MCVFIGTNALAAGAGVEMGTVDKACTGDAANAQCSAGAYAGSITPQEHLIACLTRYQNNGGTLSSACANAISSNTGSGQLTLATQIDSNCTQDASTLGCPETQMSVGTGLLKCMSQQLALPQNQAYQFQSSTCFTLLNQNNPNKFAARSTASTATTATTTGCGGYGSCLAFCQATNTYQGSTTNVTYYCSGGTTCNCMLGAITPTNNTTCTPACQ